MQINHDLARNIPKTLQYANIDIKHPLLSKTIGVIYIQLLEAPVIDKYLEIKLFRSL